MSLSSLKGLIEDLAFDFGYSWRLLGDLDRAMFRLITTLILLPMACKTYKSVVLLDLQLRRPILVSRAGLRPLLGSNRHLSLHQLPIQPHLPVPHQWFVLAHPHRVSFQGLQSLPVPNRSLHCPQIWPQIDLLVLLQLLSLPHLLDRGLHLLELCPLP